MTSPATHKATHKATNAAEPAQGGARPETIRAVARDRYGPPEVLEVRELPMPTVAPDEVLIEVHAAGVDRGVWHLLTGLPYLVRLAGYGVTRPKDPVIGMDVAGRVVAVGADVTRFRVGDEVFGIAKGSFATYAAAEEGKLTHKPAAVTMEQAAVSAVSGITALQALTDVGNVQPGQRVLVVGASGGVGSFAVQLAKALGAEVTGVCSTGKVEMVRDLGADRVIDYTRADFSDDVDGWDLILDTGGRNKLARLRRALTRTGTLVIVGGENGGNVTGGVGRQIRAVLLSPFVRQRLTTFISKEQHSSMDLLTDHMATGAVVPAVGRRFPLERAAEAIEELVGGATLGKSVIVVRGDGSRS